jgi:hypothetical protein
MPDEGLIRSPHPASSRLLPAKPIKRARDVSAIVIRVPTVVALVTFLRFIAALNLCVLSAVDQEGEHNDRQDTCDDAN